MLAVDEVREALADRRERKRLKRLAKDKAGDAPATFELEE